MKKRYLFAPGPTPIPEEVQLAMAKPIMHHRAPQFESIMKEVSENLKYLFQTKNEVMIFASSGTGPMEGAVSNTLCKGEKALVVSGGKFGERWIEICSSYGVKTEVIDVEWGTAVDPKKVEKKLQEDRTIKAVLIQASETSTGVRHPVEKIAKIVTQHKDVISVVDAITAIGVFDLPMDTLGLDVVVTGSQKALMLPPGLAFASLSDKAWKRVEKSDLPKYYFDFKKESRSITKHQSAYTSAVSLIMGLQASLRMIKDEGLESVFSRHARLAHATRTAIKALELSLYAPLSPTDAVTAVVAPEDIDGQKVVKTLREKYGFTIAGGQDKAKGKIFRIAHMGYIDTFDIILIISALEMTLKDLGYPVVLGAGVKAASEILSA